MLTPLIKTECIKLAHRHCVGFESIPMIDRAHLGDLVMHDESIPLVDRRRYWQRAVSHITEEVLAGFDADDMWAAQLIGVALQFRDQIQKVLTDNAVRH